MLNLVLFGPPGAGKGTQAELIKNEFNLIHLSTGDILRDEIKKNSVLGKQAKAFMDEGKLVTNELIINMMESVINEHPNSNGFIFDGYPRTVEQAQALDEMLNKKQTPVTAMLMLVVAPEELIKRLLLRGQTSGRTDDANENVIQARINEYNNKTAPVANYYSDQDKLLSIEGVGEIQDIFSRIKSSIQKLNS